MKGVPVLAGSLSAALLLVAPSVQAQQSQIDAHISAARSAAGMDFRNTFINLCIPAGGGGGGGGAAAAAGRPAAPPAGPAGGGGGGRGGGQTPDRANWYAPPFKIFDNLYWLGTRQHSSWALQTSEGLIIIDTNFAWATQPEIIDGLTTLGLNPNDIRYVIISHAHGDHGGLDGRHGERGTAEHEDDNQRHGTHAPCIPGGYRPCIPGVACGWESTRDGAWSRV
jgi:hypothetical protein